MLSKAVCLRCWADYLEREMMCAEFTNKKTGEKVSIEEHIQRLKKEHATVERCFLRELDYKLKAPKKGMPKKCYYALEQTVQQC